MQRLAHIIHLHKWNAVLETVGDLAQHIFQSYDTYKHLINMISCDMEGLQDWKLRVVFARTFKVNVSVLLCIADSKLKHHDEQ